MQTRVHLTVRTILCLIVLLLTVAARRAEAQALVSGPDCATIRGENISELSYWKDVWTARLPALKAEVETLRQTVSLDKENAQKELTELIAEREGRKNAAKQAQPVGEDKPEDTTIADYIDQRILYLEEHIKTFDNNKTKLTVNEGELRELEARLECVQKELRTMFTPEQRFKTIMSGAFAFLILVVIVGFFWQAHVDENVRRAVFSGVTGIQLLTLFSIIIAIILFGITGILQDKELAALLGGLSGYILGRYNTPGGAGGGTNPPGGGGGGGGGNPPGGVGGAGGGAVDNQNAGAGGADGGGNAPNNAPNNAGGGAGGNQSGDAQVANQPAGQQNNPAAEG